MNILYICGDNPNDARTGSQQRTNFLYQALQRIGNVSVFVTPAKYKVGFLKKCFRGFTKVASLPIGNSAYIRNAIGFKGAKFDAVIVRYVPRAASYAAWGIAPMYIDVDDIPIQAFEMECNRVPMEVRWLARLVVKMWQRWIIKKAAGVWIAKSGDEKFLPNGVRYAVLPNLAKEPNSSYRVNGRQQKLLITVGHMGYGPNTDGVEWFLQNIWPRFYAKHKDWSYAIVGGGLDDELKGKWSNIPGVKVLGFVDNLDMIYEECSAVVAPILAGAGSCIKVVESALHGRKTFLTPMAARGVLKSDAIKLGFSMFEDFERFSDEFSRWFEVDSEKRVVEQRQIADFAAQYNSFERFANTVKNMCFEESK